MNALQALILAIVEGITEFLPVSSTGHMIIANHLMRTPDDEFSRLFIVCIQLGAILSVLLLYWRRFFQSIDFYTKLLVAFLPAAVIGFLLGDYIDQLLDSTLTVACMLIVGGVFLLFIDRLFPKAALHLTRQQPIDYLKALKIGFFQCVALVPGVSRSAATIVGGMATGLNRQQAAEFSFFLAVPTMFCATAYRLLKYHGTITTDQISLLLLGNVVAFVVATIAIKTFIDIVSRYGFWWFGVYRIAAGLAVLAIVLLEK